MMTTKEINKNSMLVARDKNSKLQLFISSKPERDNDRGIWDVFVEENGMKIGRNIEDFIYIDSSLFPNLKWEDEPIEVCILDKSELIMENNLFENAYFGKAYKTRSGAKAIFICKRINTSAYSNDRPYVCVVDGYRDIFSYYPDGRLYSLDKFETENDIVSEWEENINEEKLDRLATIYSDMELKIFKEDEYWSTCADEVVCSAREEGTWLGFKAGYRKAKEE